MRVLPLVALALALAGCAGSRSLLPGAAATVPGAAPGPASGAIRVAPGQSIAEALERAPAGSVIEVEPGVYREALTVDTPGITLRGLVRGGERPILEGGGRLNDAVIASGSPFAMTGFRIQHYRGNGVTTQGVDGVFLSDLLIRDTGLYGVYPIQSRNITVTHCRISGIVDAAVYVGQSNRALVAYNEVHDNVAGIEIENTNDAEVRDNLVYDNTAGILVFVLPGRVQKEGLRNRVTRNWVVDNNTENFGDPNVIVGQLPHGIGLMVMGADDTILEHNWVRRNGSAGLVVVRLAPEHADRDPELEPFSDRTRVGFNQLSENGLTPHPEVVQGFGGGADLAWDGTGSDNCADLPDHALRSGSPLPSCLDTPAAQGPPSPAPPPAPGAAPAAPAEIPAGSAVVRIRGMRYEPRHLSVETGRVVTWVNEDAVAHTVTSGEGVRPTAQPLASPFLGRGETFSHRFDESGRYEYLCVPHLGQAPMRGATIRVGDSAGE